VASVLTSSSAGLGPGGSCSGPEPLLPGRRGAHGRYTGRGFSEWEPWGALLLAVLASHIVHRACDRHHNPLDCTLLTADLISRAQRGGGHLPHNSHSHSHSLSHSPSGLRGAPRGAPAAICSDTLLEFLCSIACGMAVHQKDRGVIPVPSGQRQGRNRGRGRGRGMPGSLLGPTRQGRKRVWGFRSASAITGTGRSRDDAAAAAA